MKSRKAVLALSTMLAGLVATAPVAVNAQSARRNSIVIEANPVRGSIGYTRGAEGTWNFGVQAGFGFPQIDITLNKSVGDFEDYAHIALIARKETRRTLVEVGARAGAGSFAECTVSDCWFGLYVAPSVLFAYGTERWKVGPRITAGRIVEPNKKYYSFASISPLNLLVGWRF